MRIAGADLNVFDFDFDNTWAAFFLSADETVYGRYGGRDATSAESRMSLPGLRYAMTAALVAHRQSTGGTPPRADKPLRAEEYPAARRSRGCIHCHMVAEFQRDALRSMGRWDRESIWVYPLPENIGLTLEVDRGDHIKAVAPKSPAAHSGLRPGDRLTTLNGRSVASFADAQYTLHQAPAKGEIAVTWNHAGHSAKGRLALDDGWRKTNLSWRPSMLHLLPSLNVYGDDLTAAEKKALGLAANRLAFRQDSTVHRNAKAIGVQPGDIIVGLDGQVAEMTMSEFLSHVRRNYLVGDKATLNVLRGGNRVDLPVTLR